MEPISAETLLPMLRTVMAGYDRQMPDAEVLRSWLTFLKGYTVQQVRKALMDHCNHGEFPPRAVDIARRCREMDGRPDADEAWAGALAARDESATVVWTEEAQVAFLKAQPLLVELKDKVAARAVFVTVYRQLVDEARQKRQPVRFVTSLGHDPARRVEAIEQAQAAGVQVGWNGVEMPLLPSQISKDELAEVNRRIAKIAKILGGVKSQRKTPQQIDRERTARLKAASERRVAEYLEVHT